MKNIYDVLRQKESELAQARKDCSALYRVIPMIAEETDPKPQLPAVDAAPQPNAAEATS